MLKTTRESDSTAISYCSVASLQLFTRKLKPVIEVFWLTFKVYEFWKLREIYELLLEERVKQRMRVIDERLRGVLLDPNKICIITHCLVSTHLAFLDYHFLCFVFFKPLHCFKTLWINRFEEKKYQKVRYQLDLSLGQCPIKVSKLYSYHSFFDV